MTRFALLSAAAVLCVIGAIGYQRQSQKMAASSTSQVQWTAFQDPAEQAFHLDVPQGWKVAGGMYRFGPLDPRTMVDMRSPDGRTDLRIGDANIPPFTVPTQMLYMTGFREGSRYSPGGRSQSVVARYRKGHVFADLYGQARFAGMCQQLELKEMKPLQPVVNSAQQGPMTTTAGQVVYTCHGKEGAMVGYVYAETSLTAGMGSGVWGVSYLHSFIAPEEKASAAMQMLLHSASSLRFNPAWFRYQMQITGSTVRQIAQEADQHLKEEETRLSQFESFSRTTQDIDDVIKGVTVTQDPLTGEQREVWSGANSHHWINPQGTIINTPSDMSPGSSWRQLQNQRR